MLVAESYGLVASSRPANTNEAELYAPASGVEFTGVLRIVNHDTVDHAYSVAHTATSGAAAAAAFLAVTEPISGTVRKTHEISIAMKNPETIRIQSNTADKISFHLSGMTKTTT